MPSDQDLKREFLKNLQAAQCRQGATRPRRKLSVRGRFDCSKGEESISLAVDPSQVQEFRDLTKQHGLTGIEYRNDGMAIVYDAKHKSKLARLLNLKERNGLNGG